MRWPITNFFYRFFPVFLVGLSFFITATANGKSVFQLDELNRVISLPNVSDVFSENKKPCPNKPSELIIRKLKPQKLNILIVTTDTKAVSTFLKTYNLQHFKTGKRITIPGRFIVGIRSGYSEAEIKKQILTALSGKEELGPALRYVEKDEAFGSEDATIPNDESFNDLWGLNNTGQFQQSTPDADINAPEAWDIFKGKATPVVGLIDTGVDFSHPDLKDKIWTNPDEIPGNRIDDDNNGYVDDVHGFDFADVDTDPTDFYGHGTHTAGTIGAMADNGQGIAGVNWNVKIAPLKHSLDGGGIILSSAVQAFAYAIGKHIPITSNSWGGTVRYQPEEDVIKAARDAGMLVIASAGNNGTDNDLAPRYPGSFSKDYNNVIAVAAIGRFDDLRPWSSYGLTTVQLAAPGSLILSTVPRQVSACAAVNICRDSGYLLGTGTSMATPHVAGAAAVLWGYDPSASYLKIKNAILNSVKPLPSLNGKVSSGGTLRLFEALINLGSLALPENKLNLTKEGNGVGKVLSYPAGIDCKESCQNASASFKKGTIVTLTATTTDYFEGWSGDCVLAEDRCITTMDAARNVTAIFRNSPPGSTFPLQVNKDGTGTGVVSTVPAGIDCGATCSSNFPASKTVTLTADPSFDSNFAGWSGDCSGTALDCVLVMNLAKSTTATFNQKPTSSEMILVLSRSGNGLGSITVSPPGGSCINKTCLYSFSKNTNVTMTAVADTNSVFKGWSGDCLGTASCALTMNSDKKADALFDRKGGDVALTITKLNSGTGRVVSDPPGVDCGNACVVFFPKNTFVTLTASPDSGFKFGGWTKGCADSFRDPSCGVYLSEDTEVGARFINPKSLTVKVLSSSLAAGVISFPPGINCDIDPDSICVSTFDKDSTASLLTSNDGATFIKSWSGDCSGSIGCDVVMNINKNVTATFNDYNPSKKILIVELDGDGSGIVTSKPKGINCGDVCFAGFANNTSITLTAKADSGSVFLGWSGACSGKKTCKIKITKTTKVVAGFGINPNQPVTHHLDIFKSGNGGGTIASSPSGIDCGLTCSADFKDGKTVKLTATPDSDSAFGGWSGDCSGTGTCSLMMSADKSATAIFNSSAVSKFDFSVSHPNRISVGQGDDVDIKISADLISEPAQPVTFSVSGLPDGATAVFSPTSCAPTVELSGHCDVNLNIQTTAPSNGSTILPGGDIENDVFTPLGNYNLIISGAFGVLKRNAIAPFVLRVVVPIKYNLTINKTGSGNGTIASKPIGIDCGASCSATFFKFKTIILTATPNIGSTFDSWNFPGLCNLQPSECSFTITGDSAITAKFILPSYNLTVKKAGSGTGRITSAPVGIDCGATCVNKFPKNTSVVLTAVADSGFIFAGWSGVCSGSGDCSVTMSGDKTATARFIDPNAPFDFSIFNSGNLTVHAGDSVTTKITVDRIDGPPQVVAFDMQWLRSTWTASFSPTECTPSATDGYSCSTILTINVGSTSPGSAYTLRVIGTAGLLSHLSDFQFLVLNP